MYVLFALTVMVVTMKAVQHLSVDDPLTTYRMICIVVETR